MRSCRRVASGSFHTAKYRSIRSVDWLIATSIASFAGLTTSVGWSFRSVPAPYRRHDPGSITLEVIEGEQGRCYDVSMTSTMQPQPVGHLLRTWRQRRRMSQLDLAGEAAISAKHLSFLETGRSLPSRDMLLHLAERLEIPLRERNVLLIAAGYAPIFFE